jgi:hypothetical protein
VPDGSPLEALDPLPLAAPDEAPAPSPPPPAATARGESGDWADAPDSAAPAAAVPPRPHGPETAPAPEPPASAPAQAAAPASDWAALRRKMTALGVSRYGIEGEPGGRVRFHCIIPLAGRRAVAQQFEAEGDDEIQAAEAALRRVALWRATENPGP